MTRTVLITLLSLGGAFGCATGAMSGDPGPDAGAGERGDETANQPLVDAGPMADAAPAAVTCLDGAQNMIDTATGNCLMFFPSKLGWEAARQACESLKGNTSLAVIASATENELQRSLVNTAEAWIGATDKESEGSWGWSDGSAWGYQNWRAGEPNNGGNEDCAVLEGGRGGTWDDRGCGANHGYLCERTP